MSTRRPVNAARQPKRHRAPLGQNFLVDAGAARKIADALGEIERSTVVEIGAGRGALTKLLASRAGQLIATELDEMLVHQLRAAYAEQENVRIVHANFLRASIAELVGRDEGVRIVGNIPYYITSDILLHLLEQNQAIEIAVLMVQKEVADRLVASPGTRDYGLLTVTTQLFAQVERMFTLPPSAFSPPPQVYSTVVRLKINPQAESLGVEATEFLAFCKLAFAQKRKTLFNNLRGRYAAGEIKNAVQSIGAKEDVRAEALALQELANVYRELSTRG